MQQQVTLQDEETLEMRETFSSLQQEVEMKTKKLRKVRTLANRQLGSAGDVIRETIEICTRQKVVVFRRAESYVPEK